MAFGSKSGKIDRRMRSRNSLGDTIDRINFILEICVVITAFLVIINHTRFEKMFTVTFLLAAVLNLNMSFKNYKRQEYIRCIVELIAGIFLAVMTVITFIGLWL